MAKKSRIAVLKRQREAKKAEKAAMKRERREQRVQEESKEVATQEDLEGYGFGAPPQDENEER